MKLKQLSYFKSIVDCGSFSSAAKELYVSQSSLSSSIASLEEELGFSLLERKHKGVVPTVMGKVVYEDISALLNEIESKKNSWSSLQNKMLSYNKPFSIYCVPSQFPFLAHSLIKDFNGIYPNVKIRASERRNFSLVDSLMNDKADIILGDFIGDFDAEFGDLKDDPDVNIVILKNDSYKLAINKNDPLAEGDSLSREDVKNLSLACYGDGEKIAAHFFERGFDRANALEFNSLEKIIEAALSGEAAGCLPELTISRSLKYMDYAEELVFKPLEGYYVPFTQYLAYKRSNPVIEEIELFSGIVQEAYR